MANVTQLGYLGIGVKSLDEWESYSESLLGIKASSSDLAGTVYVRKALLVMVTSNVKKECGCYPDRA